MSAQDGKNFFSHYSFYSGADTEGSKGYINYVDKEHAFELSIANVTYEPIDNGDGTYSHGETEPFIYMSTTPTEKGPRNSVRLEGLKRYNRGLFIIDVRHMPSGCGTWPAFWMSDEANWPVNGEIDVSLSLVSLFIQVVQSYIFSSRLLLMHLFPSFKNESFITLSWHPAPTFAVIRLSKVLIHSQKLKLLSIPHAYVKWTTYHLESKPVSGIQLKEFPCRMVLLI